ncbi:MAG: hypothetical protein JWM36_3222 [Hyphomicrobiales bacterium]|nr:hypothetical protein [Hyphomicrobiales bacterium]
MARVTYYVAIPFVSNEEGCLLPGEAKEFQSSESARRAAQRFASENGAGGVAFSRTDGPATGDLDEAVVIARYGSVLDESPSG